jgi:hypothetical protein
MNADERRYDQDPKVLATEGTENTERRPETIFPRLSLCVLQFYGFVFSSAFIGGSNAVF